MKQPLFFLFLIISLSTPAQITTDGSLGPQLNLPGPHYQITPDLGLQRGGNLFHSFQDFNLNNSESATFSGPNHLQNVISRVTGGNPSQIDGLFRSTIPGADVYFLNPYGIMFGPKARLDVQGSFHASTADYLRLGNGGHFDARNPSESILTVAPIEAFGFLTEVPAPITIQNSKLYVSKNKTLSLIGGNLVMEGDLSSDNELESFHPNFPLKLFAEFGQLNLASIGSSGEVILAETDLILKANQGGQIMANNTWIGVSGEGGGDIFIRAGHFELKNSELESDSNHQDSGVINIQVEQLILQGSEIATDTHGIGQGGEIIIKVADTLTLFGGSELGAPSFIFSGSESKIDNAGHAGKIEIEAHQILITESARISSFTEGTGNGGLIIITAFDNLTISGQPEGQFGHELPNINLVEDHTSNTGISGLFSNSRSIEANAGNAGTILVQSATIKLMEHAIINASAKNAGGGNIKITTSELLYLREGRITTSVKSGTGDGGDINIIPPIFVILDKAKIVAHADRGRGGNIRIVADQFITSPDSLVSASSRLGLDGNVEIHAPDENVTEGMLALSSEAMDATRMMKKPCELMTYEEYLNRSRFVVNPIAGSTPSPFDLLPSRLSPKSLKKQLASPQKSAQKRKIQPHQTALVIVCQSEKVQEEMQTVPKNKARLDQLF
jgi:filamentous hemagglutinin family protein